MSNRRHIYLVRHGEVDNPGRVVYADLPGFSLSALGAAQAAAAAGRIHAISLATVISSPLERASKTADEIAARHGLSVTIDERLTEWRLSDRWAGLVWEGLPDERPGELEAYLAHPEDLPFSAESLDDVADRFEAAVLRHLPAAGNVAFVSHQDPVQAVRFRLTGRPWSAFQIDKPGHASITEIEVRDGTATEISYWEPEQGSPFPPGPKSDLRR